MSMRIMLAATLVSLMLGDDHHADWPPVINTGGG